MLMLLVLVACLTCICQCKDSHVPVVLPDVIPDFIDPLESMKCAIDQFACTDGTQCLPSKWYCDHDLDCADGSDEPSTCPPNACSVDQFQCSLTGICIPKGYVCDRQPDCGVTEDGTRDTSDEDHSCNTTHCPANYHGCATSSHCVHLSKFCDSKHDCSDYSDEGPFCNTQVSHSDCKYGHSNTPEGPMCYCPPGQEYNISTKVCDDENECLRGDYGGIPVCDQVCHNEDKSFSCSCVQGYDLVNDTLCIAKGNATLFVVTEGHVMNFDQSFTNELDSIRGWQLRAFDIDVGNHRVCWTDSLDSHNIHIHERSVKCASVDPGSGAFALNTVVYQAPLQLEGVVQMSFDWVASNWYFLDKKFRRVFVCNNKLDVCKVLYNGQVDMPNDMAIDPAKGYIFTTDWGSKRPCLWRFNMDGSEAIAIVDSGIIHPYGVTLDYPAAKVYWLDSYLEYIHCTSYEAPFIKRVVVSSHFVKSLSSLTLHNQLLYSPDHHNNAVYAIHKLNGSHSEIAKANPKLRRVSTITVYHETRQPKVSHPCGVNNGGCSDLCVVAYANGVGVGKCLCRDGYVLDGKQCITPSVKSLLIFGKTSPGTIGALALDGQYSGKMVLPPISHLKRPTSIAMDIANKQIFYSDAANFTIQRTNLFPVDGKRNVTTVLDSGVSNCEGLAYDWVSRLLYWSDESFRTISVLSVDNPSWHKTIVDSGITHPRALAVYPDKGYIFWSDWADTPEMNTQLGSKAKIERANADGSNIIQLVSTDIHWPNGITIYDQWLYWCDAFLDRIERVTLEGKDRIILASGNDVDHPYGIALISNAQNMLFLYWSEFRKHSIYKIELNSNGTRVKDSLAVVLHNDSSHLFELEVFDGRLQNGQNNTCGVNNGGCDQMCVFVDEKALCLCGVGYDLVENKCQVNTSYVRASVCQSGQFECRQNHRCIDPSYTCDGEDDCGDNSDEDSRTIANGICANKTCDGGMFRCGDNTCISETWLCDGEHDCSNGDDEIDCKDEHTCRKDKFRCAKSGGCIPLVWVCDHEHDCGPNDHSDEHANCTYPVCSPAQLQCTNKQCVSMYSLCDGDQDCRDGSDEHFCDETCVKGQEMKCSTNGVCLSKLFKCDGFADCPDGEDEHDCPEVHGCNINQWRCGSGECIRTIFHCDGQNDCIDGSDEYECPSIVCPKDTHRLCVNGKECINVHSWCDGFNDCNDESDEINCTSIKIREEKCTIPNWICRGENEEQIKCLPPGKFCDGVQNCTNPMDEGPGCSINNCKENECSHNCHNTPDGFVCSCRVGYILGIDARSCTKNDPCLQWGICSQHCRHSGTHHYCECHTGYTLAQNKFTCKTTANDPPQLIYSNRHEIRLLPLRDTSMSTPLAVNLKNSIAIDFLYGHQNSTVFWTDIADDMIYRGTVVDNVGLIDRRPLVEYGIATAEGIAVDWLGGNLFWVDSMLDQIEAATVDGTHRTTIVTGNMQNLRALAVDPRFGLMFWTDWFEDKPRIERCTLAGTQRKLIFEVLSVPGGGWPNGLTVDYTQHRLYWIDAKSDSIHTIDYDGADHHQVLRADNFLSHPFAITIFEDHVYWTDWRVNSIVRANKWTGKDVKLVLGTSAQPFDVQVLHSSRQPTVTKNPCTENGGCSHFCFIVSADSKRVCGCPYLMKLNPDSKSCSNASEAVFYSMSNKIVGIHNSPPYANYMPATTNAWVENVTALDIHARLGLVVWADSNKNAIVKADMHSPKPQVLADAGLEHANGVAVDYLHDVVYFTDWKEDAPLYDNTRSTISVMDMQGAYRSVVLAADKQLRRPSSIVLDPMQGLMYWLDETPNANIICKASMDGVTIARTVLNIPTESLSSPSSLSLDSTSRTLFWISARVIHSFNIDSGKTEKVDVSSGESVESLCVTGKWVYYSSGSNVVAVNVENKQRKVLSNTSLPVANVKAVIEQKGVSLCSGASCPHLCVPSSSTTFACICATGFTYNKGKNICDPMLPFILYGDERVIHGRSMTESLTVSALAPIALVDNPISIDFDARRGLIFYVNAHLNQVVSINRDLTNRHVVVHDDGVRIGSVAVDYIAGNVYWTASAEQSVIEVASINGSHKVSLVTERNPIHSLHVDPAKGYLFWRNDSGIVRSFLDGYKPKIIVRSTAISDVALDVINSKICWLVNANSTMICSAYDGKTNLKVIHHMPSNMSDFQHIAVHDNSLYWFDKKLQKASIVSANFMEDETLKPNHFLKIINMDSDLTELKIFDVVAQKWNEKNYCGKQNGHCEQLCLYRGDDEDEYVCRCSYAAVADDGRTCTNHRAFIAFSQSKSIEFATVSDEIDVNPTHPVFDDPSFLKNAVGLAFDAVSKRIFFSDIQLGQIVAINYNVDQNDHRNPTIVAKGVGSVEGLAYDYVRSELYWTSYSNGTICRATVAPDTKLPVTPVVVLRLGDEDKPRGIAVDPCNKRMYWTDWNQASPRIERAYLSGMQRQTIISTDIETPNALTLDLVAAKLYWADARLDKVEMCELDGSRRKVLASYNPVSHPFGIAVYGDSIYWTDWLSRAVLRVNKFTGGDVTIVRRDFNRQPMGIVIVTDYLPECNIDACSVLNMGCQDQCLLTAAGDPHCVCFEGRTLTSDKKTCTDSTSACDNLHDFACAVGGRCIPIEATCDGHPDCPTADDEIPNFCERRVCPVGYMKCGISGMCMKEEKKCDGVNNCGHYEDEVDCVCDPNTHFACNSGMCIDKKLTCNLTPNCNDASDEFNCPKTNCSLKEVMGEKMSNCEGTTQCYVSSWICDGHNDCWNNFDERDCPSVVNPLDAVQCLPTMFQCVTPRYNPQCIPASMKCDGDKDCVDGSDEHHCPKVTCDDNEFMCADGSRCIRAIYKCDFTEDCADGSDEPTTCPYCGGKNHFACATSNRCIAALWKCDGQQDCPDGSDEVNCARDQCSIGQIECANGRCVSNLFYCDGEDDCGDDSDEPLGCANDLVCDDGRYKCYNTSACIHRDQKCNGVVDCPHGDDESDELCHHSRVTCEKGEYRCDNKVCLDQDDLVCNGVDDCGDWTDEIGCHIDECAERAPCEHFCTDKKIGYNCTCLPGYTLAADQHSCLDRDECMLDMPCSQICLNSAGSYSCKCVEGYQLEPNGRSCKHVDGVKPYLLVTNRHLLWKYTFDGRWTPVLENLTNAVAVDYDLEGGRVYWSDVTVMTSHIASVALDMSAQSLNILASLNVHNPDGLAVDWVARNLYWCDKATDTIQVANLEGKYKKTLAGDSQGLLKEPRAVCLDPFEKYLFWSDWGDSPHIGRIDLDGRNITLIVTIALKWPNAMALDLITQRVFWGDAGTQVISMVDYHGNNRRVVKDSGVKHIFSMSIFEDWLYYTDWEDGKVIRCRKHSGDECTELTKRLLNRPMGIRVVHPLLQTKPAHFENGCAHMNGFCSKLCLLSRSSKGHVCQCPDHFELHGELECVSDCNPSEFVCEQTAKCLPIWWRCDGQDDCGDNQDEMYGKEGACPIYHCRHGQFQCPGSTHRNNSHCIHPSKLCDGHPDCPLSTDEGNHTDIIDCHTYKCLKTQYKCENSTVCINKIDKCDGHIDCPNGEDERNCPGKQCSDVQYQCKNSSKCITNVWLCDGSDDCPLGDDEQQNCGTRKCKEDRFHCEDTGRCIPLGWKCDGESDCKNGQDEINCPHNCSQQQFACSSGAQCVDLREKCDGERDCNDGSDEFGCAQLVCSVEEFMCEDKLRCIPTAALCDGLLDCLDFSDEMPFNIHCKQRPCRSDEFQCNSTGECYPISYRCDGGAQCQDFSDEFNCTSVVDECKALSMFTCAKSDICLEYKHLCDHVPDCGGNDLTDEDPKMCKKRACPPSHAKCADGMCYPQSRACDGVNQCKDGSDEDPKMCLHKCGLVCDNGRCINDTLKCNGLDDCGDGSDESSCVTDVCQQHGVCPRWCVTLRGARGAHKCYCGAGYHAKATNNYTQTCKVSDGEPPLMIVAGKNELRFINPQTYSHYKTVALHGSSVNSMDFIQYNDKVLLVWTDGRSKEVKRMELPDSGRPSRPKRGAPAVDTQPEYQPEITVIMKDLGEPHGIAVDWVNGNIYVADMIDRSIVVVNLKGTVKRRLIHNNLYKPQAVAVDPYNRKLFWSDIGLIAKIESSDLDGNNRRTLVVHDLLEPSDLSVDPANGRLYWADSRTATIQSITIDGKDRKVLKSFGYTKDGNLEDRAYHVDVFEDNLYVGGMPYFSVWKQSKWGNSSSTLKLSPGKTAMPSAPVILLVHKNRQFSVVSPCLDAHSVCYVDAMCIPKSTLEATCVCKVGLQYDSVAKRCILAEPVDPQCSLQCGTNGICVRDALTADDDYCRCDPGFEGSLCQLNMCDNLCINQGKCVHNAYRGTAECNCPIDFDGPRCQRYKCMSRCEHGVCYIDQESGYPQCRCHQGYSGDRCSLDITVCGVCHNEGQCHKTQNNVSMCACPPGFSGLHCQNCYDHANTRMTRVCHNGGHCVMDHCRCPLRFSGEDCSKDECEDHCFNGGTCSHSSTGLECDCPPAFAGARCERDLCVGFCLNGGSCKHTTIGKQIKAVEFYGSAQCFCLPQFKGIRCEQTSTCDEYCGPNGRCTSLSKYTCTCNNGYSGMRCDRPSRCEHFCDNAANCTIGAYGDAQCHCAFGLGGERCDLVTVKSCHSMQATLCVNEGECYVQNEQRTPACRCVVGWTGLTCNMPTCNHYCLNGGKCTAHSGRPWCNCSPQWKGDRCDLPTLSSFSALPSVTTTSVIATVVIPLTVLLILCFALLYFVVVRRRRVTAQYKHSRMDEDDEVVNPVFMHGEDVDETTNFTNPMYDSVYQDTVTTVPTEEQQGLLQSKSVEA